MKTCSQHYIRIITQQGNHMVVRTATYAYHRAAEAALPSNPHNYSTANCLRRLTYKRERDKFTKGGKNLAKLKVDE